MIFQVLILGLKFLKLLVTGKSSKFYPIQKFKFLRPNIWAQISW